MSRCSNGCRCWAIYQSKFGNLATKNPKDENYEKLVQIYIASEKITWNNLTSHEDVKPFVCDIYVTSFQSSWGEFNHSQDKPMACYFCSSHFKQFYALQKHRQIQLSWTTSRWWPPCRATCPRRPPSPTWAGRRCTGCARTTIPSTAGSRTGSRGRRWRSTTSFSRRAASSCQPLNVISPPRWERSRKIAAETNINYAYCRFQVK